MTRSGSRIHVGGTKQKPARVPGVKEPGADNPYDFVDGKKFHPVRAGTLPLRVRTTALTTVHRYAKRSSEQTREPLKKGASFTAIAWCKGEPVEGNRIWLITPAGSRIWSGTTNFDWQAALKGHVYDGPTA